MGTKLNPGPNDCYEKAAPDEPLFTLLARDPRAPVLVRTWATMAHAAKEDPDKVAEAVACADAMEEWCLAADARFELVSARQGSVLGVVPRALGQYRGVFLELLRRGFCDHRGRLTDRGRALADRLIAKTEAAE